MACYDEAVPFSTLVGKTLTKVKRHDDEALIFTVNDGTQYKMYHSQDCCENVNIESIAGDLDDLVGTPILMAEEATNTDLAVTANWKGVDVPTAILVQVKMAKMEYVDDSYTWTFYKLRTIKGSVDIRWYGSSNGYYSESVDFVKLATEK